MVRETASSWIGTAAQVLTVANVKPRPLLSLTRLPLPLIHAALATLPAGTQGLRTYCSLCPAYSLSLWVFAPTSPSQWPILAHFI